MIARVIHRAKTAGETLSLTFDFTDELAAGETITAQSVTCTVLSGTDSTPTNVISGGATASAGVVTQKVTAGTAGVVYQLLAQATTSGGKVLQRSAALAVVAAT